MRILVPGGTAFLSAEIVRQAVTAGYRAACLARGSGGDPPPGTRWIKADRSLGENAYEGASGEWDSVIDVARDPGLAQSALKALTDRTGHWTFVSSCSVYADHSVRDAAEDVPLLPPLPPGADSTAENQGESKVAIEKATLEATPGKAHLCRAGLIAGAGTALTATATGRPAWPGTGSRSSSPASTTTAHRSSGVTPDTEARLLSRLGA